MAWHEANKEYNIHISNLFHAQKWQERAEAARQLGFMKDGRATNLLCRALQTEEDPTVINKIIEALGRIGDAKATMRIIEKMTEEMDKYEGNKYRIVYILEALALIKDKRSLEYIGTFLNSSDQELKQLAEKAFDAIEPNWREIIKEERSKPKTISEIFKIKF